MQDITIRNASLADAPRILEIYAWYVEHTVITFEYDVPSLEEFEGRMRRTMQKYPYLVIERDGRVEGYAYAGPFVGRAAYDWACELTIYLDHDARKHGMGRALYEALADRLQAMGFTMCDSSANFLFISHPNVPAKQLMDGLRERGILVRWWDKPRISNYLRVSVGTDEDMDALCRALEELIV